MLAILNLQCTVLATVLHTYTLLNIIKFVNNIRMSRLADIYKYRDVGRRQWATRRDHGPSAASDSVASHCRGRPWAWGTWNCLESIRKPGHSNIVYKTVQYMTLLAYFTSIYNMCKIYIICPKFCSKFVPKLTKLFAHRFCTSVLYKSFAQWFAQLFCSFFCIYLSAFTCIILEFNWIYCTLCIYW